MARRSQVYLASNTKSSTKEAAEIVLATRKSWKLTRSKTEKVWPPMIEAALIEALQKYRPQNTTDIQHLQRFPRRNCWISEYIKRRTGHFRSAKQVGSRLQQLRDSCRDERILKLLCRKQYDDDNSPRPTPFSDPSSPRFSYTSLSFTSLHAPDTYESSTPEVTLVRIELTSPLPHSGSPGFSDVFAAERETGPTMINLDLGLASVVNTVFSWKDPMVSLRCTRFLDVTQHHCLLKVLDGGTVVHMERTHIVLQSSLIEASNGRAKRTYLYETTFLPGYWTQCFSSADMTSIEVHQCLVRRQPSSLDDLDFLSLKELPEDEVVHMVQYNFVDLRSPNSNSSKAEPSSQPHPEEVLPEPSSTDCVDTVQTSDVLGLDASPVSPEAELLRDGRAHYPVNGSRSPGSLQEYEQYYSFSASPSSASSDSVDTPQTGDSQEPSVCRQYRTYEFDFGPASPSMDTPVAVNTSIPPSATFQYGYLSAAPRVEWRQQEQDHWSNQHQECYQPTTTDDKPYVYFWEQLFTQSYSSYYNDGYDHSPTRTDDAPLTIEPSKLSLNPQPEPEQLPPSPTAYPMPSSYSSYRPTQSQQSQSEQESGCGPYIAYEDQFRSFADATDVSNTIRYSHAGSVVDLPTYASQVVENDYRGYRS
ncbi:hypothetical protein FB446DRAFT_775181 [Lentinula raphanica]|nr:hypothetical protein FB446DRAFT_775181 [Lentinula raphanica]